MSNDLDTVVRMKFETSSDGSKVLKEMAAHSREMVMQEKNYELMVKDTMKRLNEKELHLRATLEAQRRLGIHQLSDEDKYQKALDKSTKMIRERAKLQDDIHRKLRAQGFDPSGHAIKPGPGMMGQDIGGMVSSLAGGNLSSMIPAAAIAAAIAGAITKGVDLAVRHSEMEMYRGATPGMRSSALMRELPFGGTMMDWVSRASGNRESLRYGAEVSQQLAVSAELRSGNIQHEYTKRAGLAHAAGFAAAGMFPGPVSPRFNMGTVAGGIAMQEYATMRPGLEGVTQAQRNAYAARLAFGAASTNAEEARLRFDYAGRAAAGANSKASMAMAGSSRDEAGFDRSTRFLELLRVTDPTGTLSGLARHHAKKAMGWESGGQADAVGAVEAAQRAAQTVKDRSAEYMDAKNQKQEKYLELLRAEAALEKANLDVKRGQLGVLEGRERRLSEAATALGSMNKGERMKGVQAVRWIKQFGVENATSDIMAAVPAGAVPWLRKQQEAFGETTPEHKELQALLGKDYGEGSLSKIRAEINDLRVNVDLTANMNEQKLGDAIGQAIAREMNLPRLREVAEAKIDAIRMGQAMGRMSGPSQ